MCSPKQPYSVTEGSDPTVQPREGKWLPRTSQLSRQSPCGNLPKNLADIPELWLWKVQERIRPKGIQSGQLSPLLPLAPIFTAELYSVTEHRVYRIGLRTWSTPKTAARPTLPLWLSTLAQHLLKGWLKHPRVSDAAGLGRRSRMCISNESPVMLLLAWGPHFENHWYMI